MPQPEPITDVRPKLSSYWNQIIPAAIFTSLYIWLAFVLWVGPEQQATPRLDSDLGYFYSIPFSILLGFGLIVLLTLIGINKTRLRYVLRPSRARIIGMIVLVIVTPIWLISILPVTVGFYVFMVFIGLKDGFQYTSTGLLYLIAVIIAHFVAYFVSALIITSVPSRTKRFLIFCLIWSAVYSGFALCLGFTKLGL